jgi:hypothetical protein
MPSTAHLKRKLISALGLIGRARLSKPAALTEEQWQSTAGIRSKVALRGGYEILAKSATGFVFRRKKTIREI